VGKEANFYKREYILFEESQKDARSKIETLQSENALLTSQLSTIQS
jgi:hypothetical protein